MSWGVGPVPGLGPPRAPPRAFVFITLAELDLALLFPAARGGRVRDPAPRTAMNFLLAQGPVCPLTSSSARRGTCTWRGVSNVAAGPHPAEGAHAQHLRELNKCALAGVC